MPNEREKTKEPRLLSEKVHLGKHSETMKLCQARYSLNIFNTINNTNIFKSIQSVQRMSKQDHESNQTLAVDCQLVIHFQHSMQDTLTL